LVGQKRIYVVHLTRAFHEAVTEQGELINMLLDPRVQDLGPEQLNHIATKLERLVHINESIVDSATGFDFKPWKGYLATLSDQAEHLASIAESFRMACDDESLAVLAGLANQAATCNLETPGMLRGYMDRRGTLHID
jgi:hypothetical protein